MRQFLIFFCNFVQVWLGGGGFTTCKFPARATFSELVHMIAVRAFVVTIREFGVASAAVIISPDVDDVFMLSKCVADNICDAGPWEASMRNDTRVPGWRRRWCWYGPG